MAAAAQAAKDGYNQRKAAKLYAEKRRAASADKAERGAKEGNFVDRIGNPAADVINITVDAKGVMIDNTRATSQSSQGMGSRKTSRSRMTRSTSTQRHPSRRSDDKENVTNDTLNIKSIDTDIEPYFTRKRSTDLSRRKRDSFTGNAGSWDGSMPRRRGSRSFIERTSRPGNGGKMEGDKPDDIDHSAQPKFNHTEKSIGERPRRQRNQEHLKEMSDTLSNRTQEAVGANPSNPECPINGRKSTPLQVELDATPIKRIKSETEKQIKNSPSSTISNDPESGTDGDSKASSPEEDKEAGSLGQTDPEHPNSLQALESSTRTESVRCTKKAGPTESGTLSNVQKAPSNGKWCDHCAGLGLHIAALLSELEQCRPTIESGLEASSSSGSRKGWKSMVTHTVLGESKTKSSSEKTRLQQEIGVLRATVDFLYKKVESMEALTATMGQPDL